MGIGKSKVVSMVFLLAAGLVGAVLLSNFAAGKEQAKAATNKDKLILTARSRVGEGATFTVSLSEAKEEAR